MPTIAKTSTYSTRFTPFVVIMFLACVSGLPGCGKKGDPEKPADAAKSEDDGKSESKGKQPKLPDEMSDDSVFGDDLVDPNAAQKRVASKQYEQVAEMKTGSIVIYCHYADQSLGENARKLYLPGSVEESIVNPQPKELDWYKKMGANRSAGLAFNHTRKKVAVTGVLGVIRNIDAGKLAPRGLTTYYMDRFFWTTNFRTRGAPGIIGPQDQPLLLSNWDPFDCEPVITDCKTKKKVWEGKLPKNETKFSHITVWNRLQESGGSNPYTHWRARYVPIKSAPLPAGVYEVTCKRHKHKRILYCATDNPYYGLSSTGFKNEGALKIISVPLGKHKVELHHLFYETDTPVIEVDVKGTSYHEATFRLKTEWKDKFKMKK